MLLYKDIIKEENLDLRKKSAPVELPISKDDLETLSKLDEYLWNSYDDEMLEKYNIRPGVGLAAPQIDVLKQMFVIIAYDEEGEFHHYCVINPKIISHSEELTYLEGGEGCLSVDREVKGLVHRPKKIKALVHLYDFETNELTKTTLKLEGYIAVVFQHEYDHLYGKLFFDRINKENPFFIPENSHPVILKKEDSSDSDKKN
ncbi:MAG: peptide deformylase [Bacilli bacterium]|nr:peptide deformylase [Bacilli bacterium]